MDETGDLAGCGCDSCDMLWDAVVECAAYIRDHGHCAPDRVFTQRYELVCPCGHRFDVRVQFDNFDWMGDSNGSGIEHLVDVVACILDKFKGE